MNVSRLRTYIQLYCFIFLCVCPFVALASKATTQPVRKNVKQVKQSKNKVHVQRYAKHASIQKTDGGLLKSVLSSRAIRVCIRTDIPPFGFFSGKTLAGFDVALASELTTALSIRFRKQLRAKWIVIRAAGRVGVLRKGICDMVIAAFSKTKSRMKHIAFSDVYFKTHKVLLKKVGTISSVPIVAQVLRTTQATLKLPKAMYSSFYSYSDVLYTMRQKLVDYVVTDAPIGRFMVRQSRQAYTLHTTLKDSEYYSVGVPKGQSKWLNAINDAIRQIKRSGRLKFLEKKWLR